MKDRKIKHVIFDLDGLLADTEKAYMDGWRYAFLKLSLKVPDAVIDSWVGKSISTTSAYLKNITDDVEGVRAVREEYVYSLLESGGLLEKPHATEVLDTLTREGYTLALATSSYRKRSMAVLSKLGLFEYFGHTVFGDDVKEFKPAPDLYLKALELSAFKPDETIVAEDSLTGARAAEAAGLPVVLIPDSHFGIDEELIPKNVVRKGETLLALLEYINEQNS